MNLVLGDRPLAGFGQRHPELNFIDLSALHIANCVGCFGCWTKTPGRCVIRDDAVGVYPSSRQAAGCSISAVFGMAGMTPS